MVRIEDVSFKTISGWNVCESPGKSFRNLCQQSGLLYAALSRTDRQHLKLYPYDIHFVNGSDASSTVGFG
jgi:hypothetical protein